MSSPALSPHVVLFFSAGLRKSLDDSLVQDHNNKRRPQPRILWMCLETLLNCSICPHVSSAVFWCQTSRENPKHLQEGPSALKVLSTFSIYNLNCFPDWENVYQHRGFIQMTESCPFGLACLLPPCWEKTSVCAALLAPVLYFPAEEKSWVIGAKRESWCSLF